MLNDYLVTNYMDTYLFFIQWYKSTVFHVKSTWPHVELKAIPNVRR